MERQHRDLDVPVELCPRESRHPPHGVVALARAIGIDDADVLGEFGFETAEIIFLRATDCCGQERDTNQTCPNHPAIMRLLEGRWD